MAIDSSATFNAVVLQCQCENGTFDSHGVQQGQTGIDGTHIQSLPAILSPTNSEVAEVIRRVKAGTCKVFYYDRIYKVWAPAESAPFEFWQFHGRHPFWREDGYKFLDRIATQGHLVETPSKRHFEFSGGVVPGRTAAVGATIQQSLEDWHAFRNHGSLAFRLVVPVEENLRTNQVGTYAPAKAMRDWLESIRVAGTGDTLQDSIYDDWPDGLHFDLPLPSGTIRVRLPITITSTTGAGAVTSLWVALTIDLSTTIDVDELNQLIQNTTQAIPASNVMVENLWGDRNTRAYARDVQFQGGRMSIVNGWPLAHFQDPGSDIIRTIPLASGFGRTTLWDALPTLAGTIKRLPYANEMPFVDTIHATLTQDSELRLNDIDRVVGYAGTDRKFSIHNVGTTGNLIIRNTPSNTLIHLHPGEACSLVASLSLDGTSEWRVLDTPYRYMVRNLVNHTLGNINPYQWSTGGIQFSFRPWINTTGGTIRRDIDEFSFGSNQQQNTNALLLSGLADSIQDVTVQHHGDFIFYENVELETRANGQLSGGHSAVLIRQRGSVVSVISRGWQPVISGIGSHRNYTTAYIDECQPGDRYTSGVMYPAQGTTIPFNSVRVNSIAQVMRVRPRVVV